MKTFVATLTTILLLTAFLGIVTAQEMEQETEEKPMQMPMMQGMMGGKGGMMQGGMMGQMPMMQGGMMCPMCGKMMQGGMMGGQGGMMQGMMGGMMGKKTMAVPDAQTLLALADELKLQEEQIKSLKNISLNSQKESIRKGADRSIAELELNALLSQDEIDLQQAQAKIQQIATLEGELKIAHIEASIKVKEVLTAEQRALFKEITKKKAQAGKKAATQKKDEDKNPEREATGHEAHH